MLDFLPDDLWYLLLRILRDDFWLYIGMALFACVTLLRYHWIKKRHPGVPDKELFGEDDDPFMDDKGINPATGLPMADAGVDVAGNPFGLGPDD